MAFSVRLSRRRYAPYRECDRVCYPAVLAPAVVRVRPPDSGQLEWRSPLRGSASIARDGSYQSERAAGGQVGSHGLYCRRNNHNDNNVIIIVVLALVIVVVFVVVIIIVIVINNNNNNNDNNNDNNNNNNNNNSNNNNNNIDRTGIRGGQGVVVTEQATKIIEFIIEKPDIMLQNTTS